MLTRVARSRIAIVLFMLLSVVPAASATAQGSAGSWTSTGFGYEVAWNDDWRMDETLNLVIDGSFELITLWDSDQSFVMITAIPGGVDALTEILQPSDTATVLEDNLDAPVPSMLSEESGATTFSEGYVLNDAAISVTISGGSGTFDHSLALAQAGITIDGTPILSGQPLGDTPTDLTETPTATTSTTRTTRTTRTGTALATETATASTTTRTTRTTRGGDSDTTPTPTTTTTTRTTRTTREEPTPTDANGTYTGPLYGYTLQYDPMIWTNEGERDSATADGIQLSTTDGILDIWAWNGYQADPVACLQGEEAYYPENIDGISQWEQATDANGDPLRYEGSDIAWGVFTYIYTNSRGADVPLVDYISCQPIPNQDAVLVVHVSALPESYNDVLDLTLDIVETIQFGEAAVPTPTAVAATEAPTEVATEEATTATTTGSLIDTNVQGTQYTSPSYGFTMDVPLEWAVVDETSETGTDTLVLNNGTSIVTIIATDTMAGDLSACVDTTAAQSGLDLSLDENSAGGAFRGEYGDQAFANFVYEDGDTTMMYFVGCQEIPGFDAHLIVIQQVEYSQFTSERRFRSDLESSIQFP